MTRLEAVNEILEGIGEPPVTALDTGGTSEAAHAEAILDRECRRILGRGWAANTLPMEEIAVVSTKLPLASTVIRIKPVGKSATMRLAIRGAAGVQYVYNLDDNTDVFTDSAELQLITYVAVENLSVALAAYIVKAAALKFQRFKKRGIVDDKMIQQELHKYRVWAIQEDNDLRGSDINVLETQDALSVKGDRFEWGDT